MKKKIKKLKPLTKICPTAPLVRLCIDVVTVKPVGWGGGEWPKHSGCRDCKDFVSWRSKASCSLLLKFCPAASFWFLPWMERGSYKGWIFHSSSGKDLQSWSFFPHANFPTVYRKKRVSSWKKENIHTHTQTKDLEMAIYGDVLMHLSSPSLTPPVPKLNLFLYF